MEKQPYRRRLCDRLVERLGTDNPAFAPLHTNQILLIDDDLRETALSITALEKYLSETLDVLEDEKVTPTACRHWRGENLPSNALMS